MASDKHREFDVRTRQWLAIGVSAIGLVGTILLGIVIIYFDTKEGPKLVLSAILPLVGAWLGTVLAYYFAKENFEAAANKTKELVQLGQGLANSSDPVTKHMTALGEMVVYLPKLAATATPKDVKLADVTKSINESKYDRLPVLSAENVFVYILTGAALNRHVVQKGLTLTGAHAGYTFEDMFTADGTLKDRFTKLAAFVKETATMGEAKAAMDSIKGCRDVFVTATGKANEPLKGWVTNNKMLIESEV